jgi:hypothetical protein
MDGPGPAPTGRGGRVIANCERWTLYRASLTATTGFEVFAVRSLKAAIRGHLENRYAKTSRDSGGIAQGIIAI